MKIISGKLNRIKLICIALGIIGILFVFLFGSSADTKDSKDAITFSESDYEDKMETRMKNLIEAIDGVGEVTVMITLEGSAKYSYAENMTENVEGNGGTKLERSVVLEAGTTTSKEAVVSGYTLPKIKGAAVVCSKRLTPTLQAKVIGVVSAALGISTGKIYVTY